MSFDSMVFRYFVGLSIFEYFSLCIEYCVYNLEMLASVINIQLNYHIGHQKQNIISDTGLFFTRFRKNVVYARNNITSNFKNMH